MDRNPGRRTKIGDTWYKTDPSNPFALSHSNIYSILRDKKDRMWVGTFGGGLDLAESTEKDNTSSVVSFKERSMAYG